MDHPNRYYHNQAMVLLLTALQEEEVVTFSFRPDKLEVGLDFLNLVKAQGDIILSAHLVDENGVLELPLDIVDGESFSAPIQELEREWEELLREPSPFSSQLTQELIQWNLRCIDCCEVKLANQLQQINRFEWLRQRAEDVLFIEPAKSRLINRYTALIDTYSQQKAKSEVFHKQILQRLKELLAI
ncbi:hypothetical protein EXU85_12315 [Spirosoma sp. KCTC 42546]|nr:hypothetical protein EXU85_12315 [Spirosoma sp. KCTC 42546]